jgi:cysteinyl-tRNA synthetase
MKNFFGYIWYGAGGGATTPTEAPDAHRVIEDGMDTIDGLTAKRNQLLSKAKDAKNKARSVNKTDKAHALQLMKQSTQYTHQANVYNGMIANMEQTTQSLDTATMTIQLARTMQAASLQMREQLQKVQVEDIDSVVDDLDDDMRNVQEMATAMSRPLGTIGDIPDDDELLAQLDDMETVEVELPDAPKVAVVAQRVATKE